MSDYKYQMNITWSEEDHAFLVDIPELPAAKLMDQLFQKLLKTQK